MKRITIIILVIVIAVLGYFLFEYFNNKQIYEINDFLNALRKESKIDFSEIEQVEFKWLADKNEEIEDLIIEGKGFKVKNISAVEKYPKIISFFQGQKFKEDARNMAIGTVNNQTAYQRDNFICVVIKASVLNEQGMPVIDDMIDVEIKCGQYDDSITPVYFKEAQIKKAFAEKYNINSSSIKIDITQETDNYVRGTVQVLDESVADSAGSIIFLAMGINNKWYIVFDGNGAFSCDEMRNFGFPGNMTEDCRQEEITSAVSAKKGRNFSIILLSDISIGCQWQENFDSSYFQLAKKENITQLESPIGPVQFEKFDFLALEQGKSEIIFKSLCSFKEEKSAAREKKYAIIIE